MRWPPGASAARGGLEQRSQNRQARLAGKERRLRFEARDFRLECRRVGAIDIGRIGDDQIDGTGNGVEQIAANRGEPAPRAGGA